MARVVASQLHVLLRWITTFPSFWEPRVDILIRLFNHCIWVQYISHMSSTFLICPVHFLYVQSLWIRASAKWLKCNVMSSTFLICPVHFLYDQYISYMSSTFLICPVHFSYVQYISYMSSTFLICPVHFLYVQYISYMSSTLKCCRSSLRCHIFLTETLACTYYGTAEPVSLEDIQQHPMVNDDSVWD
jgi:hypothetical protein